MTVKFYYNAIKIGDNKKELCRIDYGQQRDSVWRVTLYSSSPNGFSDAVKQIFAVRNDSDRMTDYSEKDKIIIDKKSEHFVPALIACKQDIEKQIVGVKKKMNLPKYNQYKKEFYQGNFNHKMRVYSEDLKRINDELEKKR